MDTHAKRSVQHCLAMIASFAASDPEREEGQRQFYQFMISIYEGMYENPEEYLVFPAPYEDYIRRKSGEEKKERAHATDSRESTLRNTFQQAIQFYALYLYRVGVQCEGMEEQSLVITREKYEDVLEQMERLHESKYNAERYRVLEHLGLRTWEEDDRVHIVHGEQGKAMEGLLYLCKAPDSKYKWMNFLRLDYKNAYSPIPTVEDIRRTLPEKSREIVGKLEEHLGAWKIKAKIKPLRGIVSDFRWKVEYSHKGKNICGFYADNEYFMLCIYFNHHQNITDFAEVLRQENPDMFQWFQAQFPERLCKCPNNRRVFFGEESRRICGLSNRAEVVNPDEEDLERALWVLRKYRGL